MQVSCGSEMSYLLLSCDVLWEGYLHSLTLFAVDVGVVICLLQTLLSL